MKLEKVYDELYGMIEDLKKKIGAGGSQVTITPALESGVKVADYSIGSDEGSLYAPDEYTPPAYSTTAVDTGKTWIDGRPVMRKVLSLGPLPDTTTKTVAHEIANLDYIITMTGAAKSTADYVPLPYLSHTLNDIIMLYADATNINVVSFTDVSGYTDAYVIIEYVETAETPETKNRRKK